MDEWAWLKGPGDEPDFYSLQKLVVLLPFKVNSVISPLLVKVLYLKLFVAYTNCNFSLANNQTLGLIQIFSKLEKWNLKY